MNTSLNIAATASLTMCIAAHGAEPVLWGITEIDDEQNATLVTIDQDTGQATAQFQIAIFDGLKPIALASRTTSQTLYAILTDDGRTQYRLLVISSQSQIGDSAPISGLPKDQQKIAGFEYAASSDQLLITFGDTDGFDEDHIAELNPDGSVAQVSDNIGLGDSDALGWDQANDRLIACDFNAVDGFPKLAEVIDIFGIPMWVGIADPPSNSDVGDVAINPANGRFFAGGFDADGGMLVELVSDFTEYQTIGQYDTVGQVVGIAFGATCHPDLDGDNSVGPSDLAQLLGIWGSVRDCPPEFTPADFNDDCIIDPSDLAVLLGSWGPCS